MSSSSSRGSKNKSGDVDLAALVSSIKKNVGGTSKPAPISVAAPSSSQTSPKPKKKREESSSKTKTVEPEQKKAKKAKEVAPIEKTKKAKQDENDDLPPPKERKRSRAVVEETPKDEAWDETFEKEDNIDDIFGQLKTKKEAAAAEKRDQEEQEALLMLIQRASDKSENNSVALRSQSKKDPKRRYTEDGLPIYTTEELGLSEKGGDSDLCPFDCQCCF